MIKKNKNNLKFIFVVLIYFSIGSILHLVLRYFNLDETNISNMEFIVQTILFVIVFLVYKRKIFEDKNKFKKDFKKYLILSLKLFLMLLLVKFISAYITAFLSVILDAPIETSENQVAITDLLKSSPILIFIASVFLAPFTEEIIFRLGIRKIIKKDLVFIIVSGFLFGLMHIFPTNINLTLALLQSITYVSLGCLLAYLYVKHDNIYIIIILHALNNLLSILATFLLI